jgi:hypothetical protein
MISPGYRRRRFSLRSWAIGLVLALTVGVAVLTWLHIARVLTSGTPIATHQTVAPSSFVWGGRVFSKKKAVDAWLHSRGIDYSVWAGRHPDAARIIHARLTTPPATRGHKAAKHAVKKKPAAHLTTKHKVTAPSESHVVSGSKAPLPSAPSPAAAGISSSPIAVLLVVLALLLGAFTFAPRWIWRLVLRRVPLGFEERIYPAAGAVGILVAFAVGFVFN